MAAKANARQTLTSPSRASKGRVGRTYRIYCTFIHKHSRNRQSAWHSSIKQRLYSLIKSLRSLKVAKGLLPKNWNWQKLCLNFFLSICFSLSHTSLINLRDESTGNSRLSEREFWVFPTFLYCDKLRNWLKKWRSYGTCYTHWIGSNQIGDDVARKAKEGRHATLNSTRSSTTWTQQTLDVEPCWSCIAFFYRCLCIENWDVASLSFFWVNILLLEAFLCQISSV